jgi:hypothetical protein
LIVALMPLVGLPRALGDDWWWYRAGVDNLVAGRPLYDLRLLTGPYDYTADVNRNSFNMPPYILPAIAPFAALGGLGLWVWVAALDVAMVGSVMLVSPRRHRALVVALVLCSPPAVARLVWGNIGNAVLLGISLWLIGRERRSSVAMTIGLMLASVKVLPAIPLAIVMFRERAWRPLIAAATILGGVTIGLSLATGRNLISDFILTIANIVQIAPFNLAPSAFLGHSAEIRALSLIALGLLALRRPTVLTIAAMEIATFGLVTNLYSDWLLIPVLIVLFEARKRELARAVTVSAPITLSPVLQSFGSGLRWR